MIRILPRTFVLVLLCVCAFAIPGIVRAQNSASISGTVTDPTGAVVPKATVEIHNPVSATRPNNDDGYEWKFQFLQRSVQPLSPDRQFGWFQYLLTGCGPALFCGSQFKNQPEPGRSDQYLNRRGVRCGPGGNRVDLPH